MFLCRKMENGKFVARLTVIKVCCTVIRRSCRAPSDHHPLRDAGRLDQRQLRSFPPAITHRFSSVGTRLMRRRVSGAVHSGCVRRCVGLRPSAPWVRQALRGFQAQCTLGVSGAAWVSGPVHSGCVRRCVGFRGSAPWVRQALRGFQGQCTLGASGAAWVSGPVHSGCFRR